MIDNLVHLQGLNIEEMRREIEELKKAVKELQGAGKCKEIGTPNPDSLDIEDQDCICKYCKFFYLGKPGDIGECRFPTATFNNGWPIVSKTDWCQRFEKRVQKDYRFE